MDATTVAIDLAKNVFQIAVRNQAGRVVLRRRLTRQRFAAFVESVGPETTVVMETCGSAHYWGRRCQARGATVRLLPAQYVRAYVRRDKTDRTDTDALLEADRCAALHPVPVKTVEQQTIQSLHRIRQQWQTTRTARINTMRGLLREQGLVFRCSAKLIEQQVATQIADLDVPLPELLRRTLAMVLDELRAVRTNVRMLDRQLLAVARTHPTPARLQTIPGVGVITATALVGSVPHIHAFRSGREFASWLGLTPRESSSGQRRTLGPISKRGDTYLRSLLIHGARSALRVAELRTAQQRTDLSGLQRWAVALAERRGRNRATVGLANKLARIIWAVWTRETAFAAA